MSRAQREEVFLTSLPTIERIIGAVARRHGLSPDAADEFGSWAKLKIIEDDYAVISKFRGESSLSTYLTVVIAMLYREYRVQQWGRWRPSAGAKRAGPVAVRLETLTQRDGLPLAQAAETLRTAGETTLSNKELAGLAALFPRRGPLRPVEFRPTPVDAASDEQADAIVQRDEATAEAEGARRALDDGLQQLSTEDRLIVRLHFVEAMSVADIARGLSLPQKPLYRRIERALASLRTHLERAGVSRELIRSFSANSG